MLKGKAAKTGDRYPDAPLKMYKIWGVTGFDWVPSRLRRYPKRRRAVSPSETLTGNNYNALSFMNALVAA